MRSTVLTLGLLLVSSCAEKVEPKCGAEASRPKPIDSKLASASPGTQADPVARALAAIPRATSGQFDTPERVLRFLFEKVAARDVVGSLAAFPVVEHYEHVRLKDYQAYTGGFSPRNYPLDDAPYGRLGYSLNNYLAAYRGVSLRILADDTGGVRSLPPGSDLSEVLREFDGSRLKALNVLSIKELRPEARPELNAVDRAMGVTEKRSFSASVGLDQRTIELTGFVGCIAGDWRVLFVALST